VAAPQTAVLYQVVKVLFGIGKGRVGGFNDERRGALKGFLGRNTVNPALAGEFFVVGKVEAHKELHGFGGCGRGWIGLVFALSLGLVRLIGFAGLGAFFSRSGGSDAFKFEEEFLVEAVGLLPTLEFVARLLRFFLVFCEVKLNIGVGHEISLRLAGGVSQEMSVDCGACGAMRRGGEAPLLFGLERGCELGYPANSHYEEVAGHSYRSGKNGGMGVSGGGGAAVDAALGNDLAG